MKIERFNERLTELMTGEGLTSDMLAERIGVDGSSVRLWKSGRLIFLSNIIKLADYFNCSIDFLLGRTDTVLDFKPKPHQAFHTRLRMLMDDKGVSTYRICKDLKLSSSNFTAWKRGRVPFIQTVVLICDYLDLSVDYLIGRDIDL